MKARAKSKSKRPARPPRPPRNAVVLLVELQAREGQEAALEQELRALVRPTRAERGCYLYELHRSAEQPGLFLFHETWASREHHARHLQTAHMQRWAARKEAVLASREASFWTRLD
jgi:quinol monooxygenase YgiN